MSLPPLWKVGREYRRVTRDMRRAVRGALWEPPRQWLYDRDTTRHERLREGRAELTERVAVLVLFQPGGLARSVQLTLEHLADEGWSVLVVSNAPLTAADATLVAERTALLLERPNAGYDFGGYRAGLRLLTGLGHRPERLGGVFI